MRWDLMGDHNRMNALAALSAARHAGGASSRYTEALMQFQERQASHGKRGVVQGITIYDDFAHHPTAIETTVHGLRSCRKTENYCCPGTSFEHDEVRSMATQPCR